MAPGAQAEGRMPGGNDLQDPRGPETARASSCQWGAECCPDTGPSQAWSTVAKHPRSVLCLPYSDSRSVVAFTDERPAFHKVGSAKKNWKPLYWPVQPRPPRGPASFPFPCEEERRPSWGARHARVRNFPEGPCTPWTREDPDCRSRHSGHTSCPTHTRWQIRLRNRLPAVSHHPLVFHKCRPNAYSYRAWVGRDGVCPREQDASCPPGVRILMG